MFQRNLCCLRVDQYIEAFFLLFHFVFFINTFSCVNCLCCIPPASYISAMIVPHYRSCMWIRIPWSDHQIVRSYPFLHLNKHATHPALQLFTSGEVEQGTNSSTCLEMLIWTRLITFPWLTCSLHPLPTTCSPCIHICLHKGEHT